MVCLFGEVLCARIGVLSCHWHHFSDITLVSHVSLWLAYDIEVTFTIDVNILLIYIYKIIKDGT